MLTTYCFLSSFYVQVWKLPPKSLFQFLCEGDCWGGLKTNQQGQTITCKPSANSIHPKPWLWYWIKCVKGIFLFHLILFEKWNDKVLGSPTLFYPTKPTPTPVFQDNWSAEPKGQSALEIPSEKCPMFGWWGNIPSSCRPIIKSNRQTDWQPTG